MNEVKEVKPVAPAPIENLTPRVKRAYRRRKVEESAEPARRPKAFVEVESVAAPKVGPVRFNRREAALPDARWMAEFAKALLGLP